MFDENYVTRSGENYYTEAEEKKLWKYLRNQRDILSERDYVLLKAMRLLGLRRIEAVRLDVGDVWKKETVKIDHYLAAKGCTGTLDICEELQKIFKRFFTLKKAWGESLGDKAPLFVSRLGSRLSPRAVNDIVEKRNKEAGIHSHITVHGLRHTKAQRIMRDERYMTPNMEKNARAFVQKQLRHKSIRSSAIYTMPNREEMALVAGI